MLNSAVFAGGCFWCTEAVFKRLNGVTEVVPGYCGGETKDPNYYQVAHGDTGHAESIKLTYDDTIISYDDLLEVFWATHDPTTLNKQGYDIGTEYRSAIYYSTEEQKQRAEQSVARMTKEKTYTNPIVTKIEPLLAFYPAEAQHKDYYDKNPYQGYCTFIISPKILKLQKRFGDKLKPEYK